MAINHNLRNDLFNVYMVKEGFNEIKTSTPVTKINCAVTIDHYDIIETYSPKKLEMIKCVHAELVDKMARQLLDDGFINFEQNQSIDGIEFRASVNAVKLNNQFVNLTENQFIVEDNKFTNEELIEAVKYTFPERFI